MSNGNHREINLYGRVFLCGDIVTKTGLHIGGAQAGLAIGGVDNIVIRDLLTNRPYIPGSSLRGKMRSLWEKASGAQQNWPIGREVYIHICERAADYSRCPVCQIYGVPGQLEASSPTRLVVRDVFMDDDSAENLEKMAQTDLPYTEVKWEAAIDRVTSAAVPRQMERVPAGVAFSGFEMIFSVFEAGDRSRFPYVLQSMQLLQDDYLGGQGSRGSGQIEFTNVVVGARSRGDYRTQAWSYEGQAWTVGDLLARSDELITWLEQKIPTG
jgi:CRISPR-associated protein Csm3